MSDLWTQQKLDRVERAKESQMALAVDHNDRARDMDNFMQKFAYLKTFRDDNKKASPFRSH
jgi:hypothetical protein